MSAFISLIFFIFLAIASMTAVAYSNFQVEKKVRVREKLRVYKERLEELEDMVITLDGLCENRMIPRIVNDEVIELYQTMIELDPKASYLEAGLNIATNRSGDLANLNEQREINRLCRSDAQIARIKHYCQQTTAIIAKRHTTDGHISANEYQSFTLELQWVMLMVDVISFIAQGHKAYNKHDVLTANAFYKKAQTCLLRSSHPDERRHRMIKQVADILFGRRKSIEEDLMPETEFNPDNTADEQEDIGVDAEALEQLTMQAELSAQNAGAQAQT